MSISGSQVGYTHGRSQNTAQITLKNMVLYSTIASKCGRETLAKSWQSKDLRRLGVASFRSHVDGVHSLHSALVRIFINDSSKGWIPSSFVTFCSRRDAMQRTLVQCLLQ